MDKQKFLLRAQESIGSTLIILCISSNRSTQGQYPFNWPGYCLPLVTLFLCRVSMNCSAVVDGELSSFWPQVNAREWILQSCYVFFFYECGWRYFYCFVLSCHFLLSLCYVYSILATYWGRKRESERGGGKLCHLFLVIVLGSLFLNTTVYCHYLLFINILCSVEIRLWSDKDQIQFITELSTGFGWLNIDSSEQYLLPVLWLQTLCVCFDIGRVNYWLYSLNRRRRKRRKLQLEKKDFCFSVWPLNQSRVSSQPSSEKCKEDEWNCWMDKKQECLVFFCKITFPRTEASSIKFYSAVNSS